MKKHKKLLYIYFSCMIFLVSCAPPPSEGGGGVLGIVGPFLPFAFIIILFYFLIIRPQGKQQKERETMLNSLKKGDEILTNGGIIGKIIDINDSDIFTLEISKGVNIKIKKEFINSINETIKNKS
ncbi:MAG: preprotein translocase subunit YajC [Thermodesulfobacteriota bacterium]|nr:preprotein translocase subunit YajC [Thermodesulfobacteriota bacterium]|tara:strand:- start:12119 stop:12493 length:375 start_codon:yes stop_codon:yes gene_type:complete